MWDGLPDLLDNGAPACDRAEDLLVSPALEVSILFVPVLLVRKDECDKLSGEKSGVGVCNGLAVMIAEDDASQGYDLGLSWEGGLGEFARAHGKEPGTVEEVGHYSRRAVAE